MFCENTLQKTFRLRTRFPNTFYILTVWNKVEGLVLNTKLILYPGNWRLFFGNHLFQLLAIVIDWHSAHQGEVCRSGVRRTVLTASVRCGWLDCGYLYVNLGPNVCLQATEKESTQAADSGEPLNPPAVSIVSNKSSTTLQCTTCIDCISADCSVRAFHIPALKQCSWR